MAINSLSTGFRPGVCTSSTRPTAPYEGQVIYETDTDLSYVWGGAAWQQVSGGTAVGNSGLVYVGGGALSGTTTNFVGCFTSTYRDYRIVIDQVVGSAACAVYFRMLVGSTPETAGGYYWSFLGYSSNGATANTSAGASTIGYTGISPSGGSANAHGVVEVGSPLLSARTTILGSAAYLEPGLYTSRNGQCSVDTLSAYNGIQFLTNAATTFSGQVAIYGYRV